MDETRQPPRRSSRLPFSRERRRLGGRVGGSRNGRAASVSRPAADTLASVDDRACGALAHGLLWRSLAPAEAVAAREQRERLGAFAVLRGGSLRSRVRRWRTSSVRAWRGRWR